MDAKTEKVLTRMRALDQLNDHLTFRISRMAKLLELDGAARAAAADLTLTAYRMMLVIDSFETISVSDLSKVMVIDRAQISRAASDLIRRGYLEAARISEASAKKMLALTPAGRATYRAMRRDFDAREAAIAALLDTDATAGMWSSIDAISRHLEDGAG